MTALLLVALFQSTAPVASFSAPNAPKAAVVGEVNKDGLVCRKEPVIGSRLKTKVCLTPAQLQQRAADDRDMVEKAQTLQTIRDPSAGPPP